MSKRNYYSIGTGLVTPEDLKDANIKIRHLEIALESAQADVIMWKGIARSLYEYYYLGEGSSKVIPEYERMVNHE